jgi:hypothetical protein
MMEQEGRAVEEEEESSRQCSPFLDRKIEIMPKDLLNDPAVIIGCYGVAK